MNRGIGIVTRRERSLLTKKLAQLGELAGVFIPPWIVITFAQPLVGDDPLARHSVIFCGNLLMLAMVWVSLRIRGQGCEHLGLTFRVPSRRSVIRAVMQSIVVVFAAVCAVVVAAVVMASIFGRPEGADMSGYVYLRGNLPVLILVLAGVYFNASFGEEVIYRGFLINRIAELGAGRKMAWWLGVAISSLVFGLIHADWALVGIVQMTCMGLALGVSYLAVRRNLWVNVLAHGYLDTMLIVPLYLGAG